jgi:MFS family permease
MTALDRTTPGTTPELAAAVSGASVGLLGNPNFRRLWLARGLSQTGTALTVTVIPLIAAASLGASARQMGLLVAAGMLPAVLVAVPVAVWADRVNRLIPVLIICDLLRAGIVGLIPLLWWRNALSFGVLVAVVIARSTISAMYSACSSPVVVDVVPRDELIDANGKLGATSNVADVTGPAAGAGLLAVLAAPVTLLFDAASFLLSAFITALIRLPHAKPATNSQPATVQASSLSRLLAVGRGVIGRSEVRGVTAIAFVNGVVQAVAVLFFVRALKLPVATVSLLAGSGAIGGILAGVLVGRFVRRLGTRRVLIVGYLLTLWSLVLVPFGTVGAPGVLVALNLDLMGSFGATLLIVTVFGDLQATAAKGTVARVMAFASTLLQAATATGAVLGGLLGAAIGVRTTLSLAAGGLCLLLIPRTALWYREWSR